MTTRHRSKAETSFRKNTNTKGPMMKTKATIMPAKQMDDRAARLVKQYGCGPIEFSGTDNGLYERHLLFDNAFNLTAAGDRERFEAAARSVRDVLSQRWVLTEQTYE